MWEMIFDMMVLTLGFIGVALQILAVVWFIEVVNNMRKK